MHRNGLLVAALLIGSAGAAMAETFTIDLTHPIPTFKPMAGDTMKPDLAQPWLDSKPVPTFGQQTVFSISEFPTNDGHFNLGQLVLSEHHGTHLDSPGHYVNNPESQEAAGIPMDQRKLAHTLGSDDLIGKIVVIDIASRVEAELAKNGGKPSPDKSVTDFSNASNNVVTADDIAGVADRLENGTWIALNLGWSKFFFQGPDFAKDPYINGWNHPGMNKEAVDKLIEIMEQKQILIGGIMADNIGIDSGESAKGDDDKWTNSWHAHVRLLQRGVKFVENATNLDQLAAATAGSCTAVVGAPKHMRGTGGPSRVLAICER
jgi:kynurenine formamidase